MCERIECKCLPGQLSVHRNILLLKYIVKLGCTASWGGVEVLGAHFLLIFNSSIIQLFNVDCLEISRANYLTISKNNPFWNECGWLNTKCEAENWKISFNFNSKWNYRKNSFHLDVCSRYHEAHTKLFILILKANTSSNWLYLQDSFATF